MARYKDIDKLLTDEMTHTLPIGCGRSSGRVVVFVEDIENAPTADVVPRDDAAREVVEYIGDHLRYKRKMIDIPFTSRDMRNYQCGAIDVIEYFEKLVNELKEKYTKGGERDG